MNVLLHYVRTQSDPSKPFKNEKGDVIEYDNVTLFYAELDRFGRGVVLPKDRTMNSAKIKTEEFEKVTGYPFNAFEESFMLSFFGRGISVWYEQMYGKLVPRCVTFEDECYLSFTQEAIEMFEKNLEKLQAPPDNKS